MKKKRPRISRLKNMNETFSDMFKDELAYGASGCHFSKDGVIKRLDPMAVEDIIRSKDMKTEKLTVEEIIEMYPQLSEEQITKLKEYGKEKK